MSAPGDLKKPLLDLKIEHTQTLDTLDMGKPFQSGLIDVNVCVSWLRHFAGYADKLAGRTPAVDGDYFCYTRLEPVGVAGAILPWNYPILMMVGKVGPALAAGCTLVVKPSELSPLSALRFCTLIIEAGFPPGVVNVVPGLGSAGAALAAHMDVDKIAFTGSVPIGRLVMKAAAESNLKKVTLELGGKTPVVVFSDADLDFAVEMAHSALFTNMGQICFAGSRTYVQEDIYDAFVEKAVQKAQKRKIGDPFEPDTESGPQVSQTQLEKVLSFVESGKKEGAKLMCGGSAHGDGKGYFIESTVFADVADHMRIAQEEIFGPVQQIIKFKDIHEVYTLFVYKKTVALCWRELISITV